MAFTAYTIARYKLFNVRVAGAGLLVFGLAAVSFIDVTQTSDPLLIFYRSAVLFFVLVFGIVLIRGVLKEVKLREQIEGMAKDLERAYQTEKKAKEDTARAYEVEKRANEQLEEVDKVKNQFLMTVQHDLRKPLTSAKWFLDMVIGGSLGRQNKSTLESAKKLYVAIDGSIEEVNDFLDVAQFQMGKGGLVIKPGVDLAALVGGVVERLKPQAEAKSIALEFKKPAALDLINADAVKLKAALRNFVDNAIKYTPKGSVTVELEPMGQTARVVVRDTGIGVPADKVKTLLTDMFQRTEQAQKTTTMGKGIGLHLSVQIIQQHHGTVKVESAGEGKGTVFTIDLPFSQPATPSVPAASAGR